jgi:hypothetical protein
MWWEANRCRVTLLVLPGLLCAHLISPLNFGAARNEGHWGHDSLNPGMDWRLAQFSVLIINDVWTVFENRKLRRIFGSKREEVIG